MTNNQTQILIAARNTPLGFKLCAHNTDPNQVVVKSHHPEVGALIATIAKTDAVTTKGAAYFITFLPKTVFFAALPELVQNIFDQKIQMAPTPSVPNNPSLTEADASYGDDDGESDGDDGQEDD
jgi:hypothetical protein